MTYTKRFSMFKKFKPVRRVQKRIRFYGNISDDIEPQIAQYPSPTESGWNNYVFDSIGNQRHAYLDELFKNSTNLGGVLCDSFGFESKELWDKKSLKDIMYSEKAVLVLANSIYAVKTLFYSNYAVKIILSSSTACKILFNSEFAVNFVTMNILYKHKDAVKLIIESICSVDNQLKNIICNSEIAVSALIRSNFINILFNDNVLKNLCAYPTAKYVITNSYDVMYFIQNHNLTLG